MNITRAMLMATAIFYVAVQVTAYHPSDPTGLERGADEVGAYLQKNVGSDSDLEANFAAAERMMQDLIRRKVNVHVNRYVALPNFVALKGSLNDCSARAFNQIDTTLQDFRRCYKIRAVTKNVAIRHSDTCIDEQANKIANEIETLEPQTLERMRKYTDLTIKYIKALAPKQSIVDLINSKTRTANNLHYSQELWEMLQNEAKDDLSGGDDKHQTSQMCSSYIFEPCRLFNRHLSQDFNVWKKIVDFSTKKNDDRYLEANTNYYRYLICEYIQKEGRSSLVMDINRTRPI